MPQTNTANKRIRRFTLVQRIFHALLMVAFLTQGATGLARMYMLTPWGRWLGGLFGGYDAALRVHVVVGIFMIIAFFVHLAYMLFKIDWRRLPASLIGPDSLLPRPKDLVDFFRHIGWFLGFKKLPEFDRWGYWEKFDYWAVFWGMVILGITGLMMAFPFIASRNMPGWGLNVALWIHRIEGLLAMAHIFLVHFFVAHLRRHNFPMDRAMFAGSTDFDAVRHEKPAWYQRLKADGQLEQMLVADSAPAQRIVHYLFGYAVVAVGLFLLIGALANSGRVAW